MSVLTETAPKRIWLCVSDDLDDYNMPYPELYAEDAEITWSTDQPVAVTVEYVRVDLSENAKLRAERDALKADLAAARAKIDSLRHHVKALQLLVKMQHAPQDMKLFAAEVDAIDAALAGKDAL